MAKQNDFRIRKYYTYFALLSPICILIAFFTSAGLWMRDLLEYLAAKTLEAIQKHTAEEAHRVLRLLHG